MTGARSLLVVCMLVAALCADIALAGGSPAASGIPRPVMDYAHLLEQVNHSRSQAPIESLYALGLRAAESLQRSTGDAASPLELMDDSTLTEAKRLMGGFGLFRGGGMASASRQIPFFLALARSHGDSADVAFFRAMTATRDSSDLPIYVQQQTDEAGCTRFGSGTLVASYDVWRSFVSRHNDRYTGWVRDELSQLENELTASTCACGDRDSMLRELRLFLKRFPGSELAPRVRARIGEVEAGTAGMRYHCIGG